MSDDLLNSVLGALGPQAIQQVANQLDTNPQQAQSAIQTAPPLLLDAMDKNASQPEGAQTLHSALEKDHASPDLGSVLGAVVGDGGQSQSSGGGLGGHPRRASQGLGQATGLGGQGANQLLAILAPIVMQILAKKCSPIIGRQRDSAARWDNNARRLRRKAALPVA